MKPFEFNHLKNFIAGWYIDPGLCDTIISNSEKNLHLFSSGIKEYKNCDLMVLDQTLHHDYCINLNSVIEEYKKIYPHSYENLQVWGWTPPRIQRYDFGKAYREEHCENNGQEQFRNRHLAYMTYLNDIKDGGGTEFVQHDLITPASKGLTLIWPAGWTHYHKGIVSLTEIKYIITGWLCFYPNNRS